MYKLRVYAKDGSLDNEEFFNTKELMDKRYNELFRYDLYSLNPTAWENVNNGWCRISGYQFDIEQEGVESMVEIIGKFLDSLYETSKSCNDFSVYEFQKEWYENNGYVVLCYDGHHTVFHKANNQFDI